MPTIAIVGPGAIGGILAAWLAQDPDNQVTVCARTAFDRLEVETPEGRITASPSVLTDPADAAPVDWVLVATKAYDTEGAARWLSGPGRASPPGVVRKTGVEQGERSAPQVAPACIVPAVIDCPAERTAPGRMRQRGASWIVVPDSAQ